MAYAVKYRMNFNSVVDDPANTVVDWEVDILQKDYVGSITAIKGMGDHVRIILPRLDDIFEPIRSSRAEITIASESLDEWTEFQTADVYEYYVDIKKDSSTHWRGVFVTEPFTESFGTAPYPVTLTFNDGLAELQFERYDDSGTLRSDFKSTIDILTKCFSFLPFTRKTRELINIFDDSMADGDTRGVLEQLFIFEQAFWELDTSDDVIKGENCLEIIRGILSSLKCRIIVSQDIWYIVRIGEMFDTSIKYVEYDTAGAVSTNNTIDLRQAIDKTATYPTLLQHRAGGNNTISREYQEVEFRYSSKNITTLDNNLLIDWNFDKLPELQNGSPVSRHWTRSSSVNTSMGVTASGLHLGNTFPTTGPGPPGSPGLPSGNVLVMEDSLLANTKIFHNEPRDTNDQFLLSVTNNEADTREGYTLLAKSPADNTITVKNLLTNTSDHLEIRIKGSFKYTLVDQFASGSPMMFNKWTLKVGTSYYNLGDKTWSTNVDSRVWARTWAENYDGGDPWFDQSNKIKIHHFDTLITLANLPATGTNDLTFTWFTPSTLRMPFNFNTQENVSSTEIAFDLMQLRYISSNSTEFSLQKVLGETSSTTLRTKRYISDVKHGDGPSNFSIRSFRLPTSFLKTSLWSTRGGAESLPGYKILVIDPIFENLGALRQVFSGPLYGFLELHNTISGIDSKVFAIKGYDFRVRQNFYDVKVHEVGTLSPVISYTAGVDLSSFSNPSDTGDDTIDPIATSIGHTEITNQNLTLLNSTQVSITQTQHIEDNGDSTNTAKDWSV